MVNKHRGEIAARLDGVEHRLVLTLGALADLESAFGNDDMIALATRFESGRLSARDCIRIIGCGLRGGGYAISDDEVSHMEADGGAAGYVDIVARLLAVTFGGGDQAHVTSATGSGGGGEPEARRPFAGAT